MCGIVAILRQGGQVSVEALNRAVGALEHRGPDGQKTWVDPRGRAALGHARLSIIDLATGDQPIASENEQTRIIVNGEFYGYEVIQQELERSGHHLRTRSDSEIALHLYEDLGTGGVDLKAIHQMVLAKRYKGWISLDYDSPRKGDGSGTLEENVMRNRDYLVNVLQIKTLKPPVLGHSACKAFCVPPKA